MILLIVGVMIAEGISVAVGRAVVRSERTIADAGERLRTTLASIGDAVIATDTEGRVTQLNPLAESLTGWTTDDAIGQPLNSIFLIVNEDTRQPVENPVTKALKEGVIVGLANHTILIAKNGSEVAIDDSGAPILGENGELAGVVLVFRDVTEKRREEDRRSFLAEASTLLASSLDYAATLTTVAQLAVPRIADWCAVDIASGASVERLSVAHVDPAKVQWAKDIAQRYPPDPRAPHGVHEVIRSGKSQAQCAYASCLHSGCYCRPKEAS